MSTPSQEAENQAPVPATPDDNGGAEAAAEVAAMGLADARGQVAEQMNGDFELIDESGELVKSRFLSFLMNYTERVKSDKPTRTPDSDSEEGHVQDEANIIYPYEDQAALLAQRQDNSNDTSATAPFSTTMFLDFANLMNHDLELAEAIQNDFTRFESFLRSAIAVFMRDRFPDLSDQHYFCALHNLPHTLPVRMLKTDRIGRLTAVTGTVTRTSDVRPELLVGTFRCNKCGLLANGIAQQYHYTRPTLCRNPRCQNRSANEFMLEIKESNFCDWQKLRVQENSDEIPPGSMPRSMDVIVRNEMVEKAKAGDKCIFSGSLVVIPDGSALARAGEAAQGASGRIRGSDAATGGGGGVRGLKALGVRELTYRTCFVASSVIPMEAMARAGSLAGLANLVFGAKQVTDHEPDAQEVAMEFTEAQKIEIMGMKESSKLYDRMVESICPNTFGHREVKRGILLMLLGGIHKTTAEGIRLRGDINVCIVGDPSTAKSQFLKYVHAFLPSRAVYTSGKASSAAGLTAAVQRDQDTGEYCIEAGALMLADNGICCIDEFDKMDPNDQVAIHEAMEQQTISITKAGIQATLNARASILAAANPIYGRYDRTKTLKSNVALSAPILSRFDLFFVVLDDCNEDADRAVAEHILKVHRCEDEAVTVPFTKEQMQRYIRLARSLNPKMTDESQKILVDCYQKLRQGDTLGQSRSAYRITVRQLESMIRLSEALARLHMDDFVKPAYVREAFRLLRKSIIHVETEDVTFDSDDDDGEGQNTDQVQHVVQHIGEYTSEGPRGDPLLVGKATRIRARDEVPTPDVTERPKKKEKKSKKVQISNEEYQAMSTAIAVHLRSLEREESDKEESSYLTWSEVVGWYLEQCESEIGDSVVEMDRIKKVTNLVVRSMVNRDRSLMIIGDHPTNKDQEQHAKLMVHPNVDL